MGYILYRDEQGESDCVLYDKDTGNLVVSGEEYNIWEHLYEVFDIETRESDEAWDGEYRARWNVAEVEEAERQARMALVREADSKFEAEEADRRAKHDAWRASVLGNTA